VVKLIRSNNKDTNITLNTFFLVVGSTDAAMLERMFVDVVFEKSRNWLSCRLGRGVVCARCFESPAESIKEQAHRGSYDCRDGEASVFIALWAWC
jgi:hypothetical protein